MYPQASQQGFPSPDPGFVYGILLTLLRGVAYTVEVFLRKPGTIGRQAYHGLVPAAGLVLMAVWAYIWANEYLRTADSRYELGPFILFIILWGMASWSHVIGRGLKSRFGKYPRISYDGTPWMRFRNWDEVKIKEKLEPMLVATVGGLIALMNTPLGLWLMIAGFCHAASGSHDKWRRKEKVREMDNMLERQMEQIEDMRRWGRGRW